MRIVFLLAEIVPSGGLRAILRLGDEWIEAGHEVTVYSCRPAATPHFFPTGVEVEHGPQRDLCGPTIVRNAAQYLGAISHIPACDVLIASYYPTAYIALLARLVGRHRGHVAYFVQHDESLFPEGRFEGLKRGVARWSYRLPIQMLANSAWTADEIRAYGARDVQVVGLGLDREVFASAPEVEREPNLVMTMGREQRFKAYGDFCAAMRIVARQRPRARCLVVTQERIDLPEGVPGEVMTPASDEELVACYHRAGLYVCSSLREGFGLPGLEALACGTPLVTTDCGGVREYAEPEVNCLMSPPGDPTALAAAIVALLDDPQRGASLGRAGASAADRFSWPRTARRFEAALIDHVGPR